ncbi:Guanine deaminase [Stieleria maiorica]|uniref:Guanine deaminase n=1 Tax=Stieleria maiorica TaxID=2795974 RepID=A0A5B9MAX9_9BACT|nr:amidohydrolase family protein [Stieleria maiorica]QEF97230.1 Guanine deaminase [Stieleria maiorica]
MITLGGQILQSEPEGYATIRPGVVEIAEGRIVGVEFGQVSNRVDHGGPDALICPGFIDTHLHLPQFDSIGAAGMRLLPWLKDVIFPAEQRWNDLDFAKSMIDRVARQCLGVGTTGVCAYATVNHEATIAALTAFRDIGFRGVIGQVMMDRDAPPPLLRPRGQLIDEVSRTLDQFPPDRPMAAAVTPRFALSCSEALLEDAGRLAASYDAIVQTHLAETVAECDAVGKRFGGRDYVNVYACAALLTPRSILGHGIHLDSQSQDRLARCGSIIAHCPTANSFLGSGTMNRHSHLSHGIPLTLGSDIGAGFERSMVRVGRAMIEAAMRISLAAGHGVDDQVRIPSAAEAWHQITAGNAAALRWNDVGRIAVDQRADLLVIRPDIAWLDSRQPLATLMFAWDDRWIETTILEGRVRFCSA